MDSTSTQFISTTESGTTTTLTDGSTTSPESTSTVESTTETITTETGISTSAHTPTSTTAEMASTTVETTESSTVSITTAEPTSISSQASTATQAATTTTSTDASTSAADTSSTAETTSESITSEPTTSTSGSTTASAIVDTTTSTEGTTEFSTVGSTTLEMASSSTQSSSTTESGATTTTTDASTTTAQSTSAVESSTESTTTEASMSTSAGTSTSTNTESSTEGTTTVEMTSTSTQASFTTESSATTTSSTDAATTNAQSTNPVETTTKTVTGEASTSTSAATPTSTIPETTSTTVETMGSSTVSSTTAAEITSTSTQSISTTETGSTTTTIDASTTVFFETTISTEQTSFSSEGITSTLSTTSTTSPTSSAELLPFGLGVGDVQGRSGDDLLVAVVDNPIGITCDCVISNRIFIYTNGYITLDSNFESPNPASLDPNNNPQKMVAPFWSDIDMKSDSKIWYQLYNRFEDAGASDVSSVLSKVQSLVVENFRDSSVAGSFEPNTALVVTWENVVQSPARDHAAQNATFQLIFTSDGVTTYTTFLFKTMNFLPPEAAMLGYKCGNSSASLFNHPASLTTSIYNEVINNGDNANNLKGMWVYKLDTCPSSAVNYVERCHTWRVTTARDQQESVALAHILLAPCPCNIHQIEADPRFTTSPDEPGCYFKVHSPNGYSFTRKCCYNTVSPDGPLLVDVAGSGYVYLYNPLVDPALSYSADTVPYTWCCVNAGLCDVFFNQRNSDNCLTYKPPESGVSYGDPHIKTIDGLEYTYNGLGEFTMLDIRNVSSGLTVFELQSRTLLAQNETGSEIRASIFSAFAAKAENNASMQVEVNLQKDGMIVFCNGLDVTNEFYADANFVCSSTNQLRLSRSRNNHSVGVLFSSEIALQISFSLQMLDLSVFIPKSLSNVTQNRGLLGNINGDQTDDLTLRNGSVMPDNSSEKEIFHTFGESWRVNCADSLFYHRAGESCEMYQNTSVSPLFLEDFTSAEVKVANETCKGDKNCLFDYIATQNMAVAENTKHITEVSILRQEEAANTPPSIVSQLRVNATVGQNTTLTAVAVDSDGDMVTVVSPDSNSTGTRTTNISYIYLPTTADQQISFWAVDVQGSASNTLTVTIVKCSGCSDHGVCDFDHPKRTGLANQFTAPCLCEIGWEGSTCSVDVDGCHDNPCQPPYICTDNSPTEHNNTGIAYKCSSCPDGYEYGNEKKCVDVDECANGTQCSPRQSCSNVLGSYRCACNLGYREDPNQNQACLDVNECLEQTSGCQQLCNNTDGGYECYCRDGYSLRSDNKTCLPDTEVPSCTTWNCSQTCLLESGSPKCYCNQGYTLGQNGKTCNDINECTDVSGKKCPQICTNTAGGYTCSCLPGFQLKGDQKSCTACDSVHWGVNCNQTCDCTQNSLSCDSIFGCRCKAGWTGTHCEVNVNECQDGGPCKALENCVDTQGSYVCQCKDGYQRNDATGECKNIDECAASLYNCTVLEVCVDTLGSYRCDCKSGYQRETNGQCQDVNECELQIDLCTHHCINTEGSYNCRCNIGYTLQDDRRICNKSSNPCEGSPITCDSSNGGCTLNDSEKPECFCNQGFQFNSTTTTCKDIDECAGSTHGCSDTCNNTAGGFFCSCPTASGLLADSKTCQSCNETDRWGTSCENQCSCGIGASYCDSLRGCVCNPGWSGTLCSTDINECSNTSTNDCGENSQCVNREPSYVCLCDSGYTRASASRSGPCTDINECETNQHDCSQRCHNLPGSFRCACSDGFQLQDDNKTCTSVDECKLQTSDCQQICVDTVGSYHCQCYPGFSLANDLRTCIKDPAYDPCNATGQSLDCLYACRITDGIPECYCDSNSRLDPSDNKTCIALDNKILVNLTTDFPFQNDLSYPPSITYKNTKKDFEDSLKDVFRMTPGLESAIPVVTKFRTGAVQSRDTTVEFYLLLNRDKTAEDVANVSSTLVNLRQTKIIVSTSPYSLLQEPSVGPSQEPAVCIQCPLSCYIYNETTYQCRAPPDENTLTIQLSLETTFESAFNDSHNLRFKEYSDQISSSLRKTLSSPNIEEIYVSAFRELSNSKTQITALVLMKTSVTEPTIRTAAQELYQKVDSPNCLTVSSSCVKLKNQTYIGNSSNLVAVICYNCSVQETCEFVTNRYQCVETPSTTATTPTQTTEPSNTDLIFGLGLGLPLALILFLLTLILMCLLCRRYKRRSDTESEFSSVDPYHIREAFGSVNSKLSGHKLHHYGGLGVGMFGASPFGQQPRDIVESHRQQEDFGELPYNYGNQFYRQQVDNFNDSSHFDPRREDLPPSSNFSWDFLFHALDPRAEFRIDRPTFDEQPTAPYQEDFGSDA